MQETWVQSLGQEDPLEKEMATHSSTLAWKIPWTEKPGRLQSMGSQRVRHDWATSLYLLFEENIIKITVTFKWFLKETHSFRNQKKNTLHFIAGKFANMQSQKQKWSSISKFLKLSMRLYSGPGDSGMYPKLSTQYPISFPTKRTPVAFEEKAWPGENYISQHPLQPIWVNEMGAAATAWVSWICALASCFSFLLW